MEDYEARRLCKAVEDLGLAIESGFDRVAKQLIGLPNIVHEFFTAKKQLGGEGGGEGPRPLTSTLPQSDTRVKRKVVKNRETVYPDDFEEFWKAYPPRGKPPSRNGKGLAFKRWKRVLVADRKKCIPAVTNQVGWGVLAGDPQFIPMASTWLNQGRWDDEKPEGPKGKGLSGGDFEDKKSQDEAWGEEGWRE